MKDSDRHAWDQQYHDGRWSRLSKGSEDTRYLAIADRILSRRADRILDLGCGAGLLLSQLNHDGFAGRYVGLDWSHAALPKHSRRAGQYFICGDVTLIPLAGTFDEVVLSEVFYYLSDPWPVLRHALTLVEPGGELLISLYQAPANLLPELHSRISELESGLRKHESVSSVYELCAANGRRRWALYVLSIKPGGSGRIDTQFTPER